VVSFKTTNHEITRNETHEITLESRYKDEVRRSLGHWGQACDFATPSAEALGYSHSVRFTDFPQNRIPHPALKRWATFNPAQRTRAIAWSNP